MIYLSDLKPEYAEAYEQDIRKNRSDLIEALDNGDTIVIGEDLGSQGYKKLE